MARITGFQLVEEGSKPSWGTNQKERKEMKHPFQRWCDENGVKDISFFPLYTTGVSAYNIMDSAMMAIEALEAGKATPYVDPIEKELLCLKENVLKRD